MAKSDYWKGFLLNKLIFQVSMDGPLKKRSFVNENIVKNGRFAKMDGHLKIVGRTKLLYFN